MPPSSPAIRVQQGGQGAQARGSLAAMGGGVGAVSPAGVIDPDAAATLPARRLGEPLAAGLRHAAADVDARQRERGACADDDSNSQQSQNVSHVSATRRLSIERELTLTYPLPTRDSVDREIANS